MKKARDNGESVVVITVSSALSGSYQSAVLARDLLGYEGCYVIDSKSASAGQKLLVNEALRLRDNGFTAKEIAEHLLKFRSKIMVYACIDDMKYLYGGGRHTNAAALLGSTGRIKPVISITGSGSVAFEAKTIGMRHGMNHMLMSLKKLGIDQNYPLYIMHTNAKNQALYLSKLIISKGIPFVEGSIVSVGSVVGSHIGEGSTGIAFVKKSKEKADMINCPLQSFYQAFSLSLPSGISFSFPTNSLIFVYLPLRIHSNAKDAVGIIRIM